MNLAKVLAQRWSRAKHTVSLQYQIVRMTMMKTTRGQQTIHDLLPPLIMATRPYRPLRDIIYMIKVSKGGGSTVEIDKL